MSGPWEKYGRSDVADGPWTAFDRRGKQPLEQIDPGIKSPVSESTLENIAAGVGAGMTSLARGVGQRLGIGPSREEVDETRRLEKPLMDTVAGFAGNIGGQVAATLPVMAAPGGNTLAGAQLMGLGLGASQPVGSGDSVMKNLAVGEAGAIGGKLIGDGISKGAAAYMANKTAQGAKQAGANALKDAALKESQAAGYVLPKSDVNPSFLNNRLESLAGKAALKQDATFRNQEVTNRLARELIGVADDQPLSKGAIEAFRKKVAEPYRQVAALDNRAAVASEALKTVRNKAQTYWNHYNRTADPDSLAIAQALNEKSNMLEGVIDKIATKSGKPELLAALRESRKKIAQSYDLQRALNETTGDVSASTLGKILAKGKPMTDELGQIAKFSRAFPKFSGNAASTPAAGVSKAEALASALLAMLGGSIGGPAGVAAGALPLMSGPTRNLLLSQPYQKMFVNPQTYGPGIPAKAAAALAQNPQLQRLMPPSAAALGVVNAE
jgi:hypothetical protein